MSALVLSCLGHENESCRRYCVTGTLCGARITTHNYIPIVAFFFTGKQSWRRTARKTHRGNYGAQRWVGQGDD